MRRDFLCVYVAYIKRFSDNLVLPDFMRRELQQITSQKVIDEKRAGYGLLKYAVKDILNCEEDFNDIYETEHRKPMSGKYHFSISHSGEVCVVALSSRNVGVDIEKINLGKDVVRLKNFILHADERPLQIDSHEQIFTIFTQKEAKFKFDNGKVFLPKNINTQDFAAYSTVLKTLTDSYALSCVSELTAVLQIKSLID